MKKNHVADLYRTVKNSLCLRVHHGCIFEKQGKDWKKIPELDLPIKIRGLFEAEVNESISTNDVKEVIERIAQDPELQLQFTDEIEERYVNTLNGIYDVKTGKMILDEALRFSYTLNFEYIRSEDRKTPCLDQFLQTSFPEDWAPKENCYARFLATIYLIIP